MKFILVMLVVGLLFLVGPLWFFAGGAALWLINTILEEF
jgi:hypothetical protein